MPMKLPSQTFVFHKTLTFEAAITATCCLRNRSNSEPQEE
jgi:hypothetical protein